jgi:hypothetical protein
MQAIVTVNSSSRLSPTTVASWLACIGFVERL